ncbi:hypothetical protein BGZ74_008244 [Mortierella antarctica]|nr:hypothetical protein BGZ74_008244 [Mortierella antarctica]
MPVFNLFSKKDSSSSSSSVNVETRKLGYDGLPISKRTIAIAIDSGATFGPNKIPLIHAAPNAPAEVVATITFETDRDCTADAFEIKFKGIARVKVNNLVTTVATIEGKHDNQTGQTYEDIFHRRQWEMPLPRVEHHPRVIPRGVYTQKVRVVLDPIHPSSSRHRRDSVAYYFHAQLSRYDANVRQTLATVEATQHIWVLNVHSIPESLRPPSTATEQAFKSMLTLMLSVPSSVLTLGQVLPLTIKAGPFTAGSKYDKRAPVVVSASFKLVETRRITVTEYGRVEPSVVEVVSVPLVSAWPTEDEQWLRTVNVTLPGSPELTPTTETKVVEVSHVVAIKVKVKARGEKDKSAEEIRLQLDVKVVPPQPTGVFRLPEYDDEELSEKERLARLEQ